MKFNTRMQRMSKFRVLVGGVQLIVVAMSALFVVVFLEWVLLWNCCPRALITFYPILVEGE